MNNTDNDLNYIKQTLDGDKKAFAYLVNKYNPLVFGLAMRMIHDKFESEDICQEVFLRVYKKLDQFKIRYQFRDWLYTIALNVITDKLRKKKFVAVSLDNILVDEDGKGSGLEVADQTQNPETIALDKEKREELVKLINLLPVKYKIAIVLRYLESLSYQEIATITRLPLGTVKTFLFRAQKNLFKKMKHFYEFGRINK